MGYSKESERQNQILGDLLSGKEPEKRIMVGYKGKPEPTGDKISKMSEIMADARIKGMLINEFNYLKIKT